MDSTFLTRPELIRPMLVASFKRLDGTGGELTLSLPDQLSDANGDGLFTPFGCRGFFYETWVLRPLSGVRSSIGRFRFVAMGRID